MEHATALKERASSAVQPYLPARRWTSAPPSPVGNRSNLPSASARILPKELLAPIFKPGKELIDLLQQIYK